MPTSVSKLDNRARKGLTWGYIVVTSKHIRQIPGSMLYHDFIAGLFEAM
jgi:hypothetical protein